MVSETTVVRYSRFGGPEVLELLSVERPVPAEGQVLVEVRAVGVNPIDAIHLAARTEGMLTDPVYEGKSMAGLIDLVGSGDIPKDSNVLYAHLGGQPALNAYSALFRS